MFCEFCSKFKNDKDVVGKESNDYFDHIEKDHSLLYESTMSIFDMNKNIKFLTKERFVSFIKEVLPENTIIAVDQEIKWGIYVFTPAIYVPEYNLMFEFDDSSHFTDAKQCTDDIRMGNECDERNVNLIRFPYYLQLSYDYIDDIKNCSTLSDSDYIDAFNKYIAPHGFVRNDDVLPADFCYLGLCRFVFDMVNIYNDVDDDETGTSVFESIILSLLYHICFGNDALDVFNIPIIKSTDKFVSTIEVLYKKYDITKNVFM